MDIGFKNHSPEFLRTPEVRNAGSTECRMCGKPGECRKCGTPEERREESEDGEENSEERPKEERNARLLDKSIFDNLG